MGNGERIVGQKRCGGAYLVCDLEETAYFGHDKDLLLELIRWESAREVFGCQIVPEVSEGLECLRDVVFHGSGNQGVFCLSNEEMN